MSFHVLLSPALSTEPSLPWMRVEMCRGKFQSRQSRCHSLCAKPTRYEIVPILQHWLIELGDVFHTANRPKAPHGVVKQVFCGFSGFARRRCCHQVHGGICGPRHWIQGFFTFFPVCSRNWMLCCQSFDWDDRVMRPIWSSPLKLVWNALCRLKFQTTWCYSPMRDAVCCNVKRYLIPESVFCSHSECCN